MMKTVHIISHSHWDREWYLPYEKHHMLLVELIDDVLELFETDPEFKSFYLDGQTIILDDYLAVRPQKKPLLEKHIQNGNLKIGPFYILQDAFLTSSESNVRNMLIGHRESKKWGSKVDIGYYPDTFGNVGQTPQLMKQLGFDIAAYGRGVKPTGFANKSTEEDNFVSSYSEMKWVGVDQSEIIGLLFANWYSNGNEVPATEKEAKIFWDQKLKDAEAYASMDQLLFMNGCDHQPVQRDLSKAIEVANELYPDYNFVHSNFEEYMGQMMSELPEDLDTVKGELTSQETEGWYTLTNTASARTYLKQANHQVSVLLEQIAEPLATMAYEVTGEYPHDQLDYAWKIYMQNHPHDSICGCSVDEVHAGMMTRFQNARNVGEYVKDESMDKLTNHIKTAQDGMEKAVPFVVFNTAGSEKNGVSSISLDTEKIYFSEQFPTASYEEIREADAPKYKIVNASGEEVEAEIINEGPRFGYELPKDAFRRPYISRNITVQLPVKQMASYSWDTYYLVPVGERVIHEENQERDKTDVTLKNDWVSLEVNSDGTISVTDLKQNRTYSNLLVFEDVGDIGNEYVFKQPNNEKPIYSLNKLVSAQVSKETTFFKELTLVHEMDVPVSADEQLEIEQQAVVEFRNRKAQRVKETKPLRIETTVSLVKNSRHLSFSSTLHNEMKDHRLRVLFPTGIQTDVHYADSIFETVKRENKVSAAWTNPTNPQRTHRFINVRTDSHGMVLAPQGIPEYEVISENDQQTIGLTLFRAVGEMGDWGYFPTPEAQCQGTYTFDYYLSFHGKDDVEKNYKEAIYSSVPLLTYQTDLHDGTLKSTDQFLSVDGENIAVTALKRNAGTNNPVTRFYNFTSKKSPYKLEMGSYKPVEATILEEEVPYNGNTQEVKPFEIKTHIWKKMEESEV
ncbi:alpha-mannosidase [Desemzia sp. FAM 23991]|uniref:alpha-mannosidase n=1 Tax=unclassified Desemzia TaxID=2685243 RepID=UPI00388A355A